MRLIIFFHILKDGVKFNESRVCPSVFLDSAKGVARKNVRTFTIGTL